MTKIITTARGEALNLDALIAKSQRPGNYVDPASKITPAARPEEAPRALNLRGHMPAQSTMAVPQAPEQPKAPVVAMEQTVNEKPVVAGSEHSIADFTMIKIADADSVKVKPGAEPAPGDGAQLAEKILSAKQTGQKKIHGKAAGKTTVLDDLDDADEGIGT